MTTSPDGEVRRQLMVCLRSPTGGAFSNTRYWYLVVLVLDVAVDIVKQV